MFVEVIYWIIICNLVVAIFILNKRRMKLYSGFQESGAKYMNEISGLQNEIFRQKLEIENRKLMIERMTQEIDELTKSRIKTLE